MAIFILLQIPVAVAHNLETLLICRFFGGIFGSAPIAILGGMYVDFLGPVDIGIAAAVLAGAIFLGPTAGPITGSFITQSSLGWRWTIWITFLMAIFFSLLGAIVTPETFEPILLRRRAKERRYITKNWALHAKSEESRIDSAVLLNKYLTKPLQMIVLEPIVSSWPLHLLWRTTELTMECFSWSSSQCTWLSSMASYY